MTAENFCYWLQGLLELAPETKELNAEQVKEIRTHLKYVFAPKQVVPSQVYSPQQQGPGAGGVKPYNPFTDLLITC